MKPGSCRCWPGAPGHNLPFRIFLHSGRADPFDIGFLGPYALAQVAGALAELVKHFGCFSGGRKDVPLFTNRLLLDESSVDSSEGLDAMDPFPVRRSGVMRHAPELCRRTVAP